MRFRSVLVPIIAIAGLVGACSSDDDGGVVTGDTAEEATAVDDGTAAAGEEGAHNDADVEFAKGMIPHHAQAIEMAEMALEQAESPDVKALAGEIQAAQQPEIDMLTEWLESWGEEVPSMSGGMDDGDMGGGGGMMAEEDMASLESASGAEFDQMFLEMMIEHHKGAIEMAEAELEDGEFADAQAMARDIIDAQQSEIEEMEGLLEGSSTSTTAP